jgi:hypothetical protein
MTIARRTGFSDSDTRTFTHNGGTYTGSIDAAGGHPDFISCGLSIYLDGTTSNYDSITLFTNEFLAISNLQRNSSPGTMSLTRRSRFLAVIRDEDGDLAGQVRISSIVNHRINM